jgi:hypothetical protein
MDYTPILAKNFDVNKIRYSPLKKLNMSKSVYINYAGEKRVIQFPMMHVPYGLSDSSTFKDKSDPSAKIPNYTMSVSFKGHEDNKAIKNIFTKLQEIEDKIKADVYANRITWMNEDFDNMENLVSRLFSSNIQFDRDKETKKLLNRYPATFRVKVPSVSEIDDDGNVHTIFKFDASDEKNNEIQFGAIINSIKDSKAHLIVHMTGLWFAGGKYGCTWKLMSGRFQVARSVKYQYVEDSDDDQPKKAAVDEDDDDEDADIPIEVTKAAPDVSKKAPAAKKTQVAKSDDDDEDEEEEEVVVETKKAVPQAASDEEDEEEDEEEVAPPPPPPPANKLVKKAVAKK